MSILYFSHISTTDRLYMSSTIDINKLNNICAFCILGLSMLTILFCRITTFTYMFNWPRVYTCAMFFIMAVQEKLWIDFFENISLTELSKSEREVSLAINYDIKSYMIRSLMYRSLPFVRFSINGFICICLLYTSPSPRD